MFIFHKLQNQLEGDYQIAHFQSLSLLFRLFAEVLIKIRGFVNKTRFFRRQSMQKPNSTNLTIVNKLNGPF